MDGSNLSERLRFDMKFLIWRAEVYSFSASELEARFQQISNEYLALASVDQRQRISRELADWRLIVRSLATPSQSA